MCVVATTLVCLARLTDASIAHACSEEDPIRHNVRVNGTDVVALADPVAGRIVALDGAGARVLAESREHFRNQVAAFTSDGHTMILAREDFSDEDRSAGCMATFVHVERVDTRTGTRTPIRRLRAAGVRSISVSSDDRWFVLNGWDNDGEPVVHLFDLETGGRVRVTRDFHADFLDADTLLIADPEGGMRIAQRSDNRTLARVPTVSGREDLSLVPGRSSADAFTLLATPRTGRAFLVEASRIGRRVTLRRAALRAGDAALAITADGTRVLVLSTRQVRLLDRATLREVARVSGAPRYTNAAISADGGTMAVVSIRRATRAEIGYMDPSGGFPPSIERFDVDTGARVAWGAPSHSTLDRTEPAPAQ